MNHGNASRYRCLRLPCFAPVRRCRSRRNEPDARSAQLTKRKLPRDLLGPYADKAGRTTLDNGCEPVLQRNAAFAGPGHNAGLLEDAEGRTWMFYHAYDLACLEQGRLCMLDEVRWDDEGWPYIATGSPSSEAAAPVVEK